MPQSIKSQGGDPYLLRAPLGALSYFGHAMKKDWNDLTYYERKEALSIAYAWYHKRGYFGSQAQIPHLIQLINDFTFTSMLDYGCGTGRKAIWDQLEKMVPTLKTYYPYDPFSTDPTIRQHPNAGRRFDLVSCTDVLEHCLPEDIDDMLTDLITFTQKMLYVTICLSPAGKMVVDANGETAYNQSLHTIVESKDWWISRFQKAERAVKWKEDRSISIKIVWT